MHKKYSVDDYLHGTNSATQNTPAASTHQPTDAPTTFTRKGVGGRLRSALAELGAFNARYYAKNNRYTPAPLQTLLGTDAVHHQALAHKGLAKGLGAEFLAYAFSGNGAIDKGVKAYRLAQKFDRQHYLQGRLSHLNEALTAKIADWARRWAHQEVKADTRFERLATLGLDERHAFADDIGNQARAHAMLGGVSGLLGLTGVVLDTAWLLLVCLKSVYALSLVYEVSFDEEEAKSLAYGVLLACDLQKLEEKQVLMTALALGKVVLDKGEETSILEELKKVAKSYPPNFVANLDEIGSYVNLDKLNGRWLRRFVLLTASVVSAHYNSVLIEEVLGVAKQTFATKLADNEF